MKAIVLHHYGSTDQLQWQDFPVPEPGEGEVLIKIEAIGVNPVDSKIRAGYLDSFFPTHFPLVLGWDMSGTIVKRGFAARGFELGEAVYGYCRRPTLQHGTYCEYIALPEPYLTRKPSNLSFAEAAGVPLAGLTAFQSLVSYGKIRSGNKVLIVGASGGVGSFAVQIAKLKGAHVTAIASQRNESYLQRLGADQFLDYQHSDFSKALREMAGDGFDLIYDCYGESLTDSLYSYSKPKGTLVSILNQENKSLSEKYSVQFFYVFVEPNSKQLEELAKYFESGKMSIHIETSFPLSDAAKAHQLIDSKHTKGKIVLIP